MNHVCTAMRRLDELRTVTGFTAYSLYKCWLEKQRKKPPPIETYAKSTFYTAFYKFASWVHELKIPDKEKYIELMIDNNISPINWRHGDAYQLYINHWDRKINPMKQVETSLDTLIGIQEKNDILLGDVFKQINPGEMIELLQQRKLSPWLLLCSVKFRDWYNNLHESDRLMLKAVISYDYWVKQFEEKKLVITEIKELMTQLEI